MIKKIINYIILFLSILIFSSVNWAIENYAFTSFDEIMYTLNTSILSTSRDILWLYVKENVIFAIIVITAIIAIFTICKRLLNNAFNVKDYLLVIKVKDKNLKVNITRSKWIKRLIYLIPSILLIISIYIALDKFYVLDYIKNNLEESNFFESEYVTPQNVNITFPEKKQNLIYIYMESMETTYAFQDNGGAFDTNYIPELTKLAEKNINFSNNNQIGGAEVLVGGSWTIGAMVSQTSGVPLKTVFDGNSPQNYTYSFVEGAYALGNILDEEGYKQYLMVGSDSEFGGRKKYFETHGNYKVYDYYTAIEDGIIDEDYYVFWGYEDTYLFEYAKEKLEQISKEDGPFNFTMLTVDTHTPDGYLSDFCKKVSDNDYLNAVACSSKQVYDFIEWIQKQDFYKDTTIILTGDHLSMNTYSFDNVDENYERKVIDVFINPVIDTSCSKNREFSTLDYFPTTLAAIGAKIEGERLGLGTNLFSCEETLSEKYGYDYINEELNKKSKYYNDCIYYDKCELT